MVEKKKTCNLTMDGGGSYGVFHVGTVLALKEAGYSIEKMSTASMGTVVGFFVRAGKENVVLEFFKEINSTLDILNLYDLLWFPLRPMILGGVFSQNKVKNLFKKHVSPKEYRESKIEQIVTATNYNTGLSESFSSKDYDYEDFINACCASWAIPGVFDPVKIGDSYYMDASLTEDVPLYEMVTLKDYNKKIPHIVSLCEPKLKRTETFPNIINSLVRSQLITFNEISRGDVAIIEANKYRKKNMIYVTNDGSSGMEFHLDYSKRVVLDTIENGKKTAHEVLKLLEV
jgi:predicted patatin/cPLA2 family phospholipase